jgi:LmbE family N-acetylglucosaminyl deacetylase
MSVLVVVAHPDDEALGFAGVIAHAVQEGRRVRVAIATNGDDRGRGRLPVGRCGTPRGAPAKYARQGLCRNGEAIAAAHVLGLDWSADPFESDLLFLGYPNYGLEPIAHSNGTPWTGDRARLHRTYATSRGSRCDGDLRFLLEGRHSPLTAAALAADLDALLTLADPTDVYTHAWFDGHPDHAELYVQLMAAIERRGRPVTLRTTLIHPHGSRTEMARSALEWPNPSNDDVGSPFERFAPAEPFHPPPGGWGPLGEPNELVEVPEDMLEATPAWNRKWRAIACHASQIVCHPDGGEYHPSCGYLRAFVKRHEFFWTQSVG